jgi:hypothetical protein
VLSDQFRVAERTYEHRSETRAMSAIMVAKEESKK